MTVGSEVKSCYISIKSAEATLEAIIAKSTSPDHQQVYKDAKHIITDIKEDLYQQVLFLQREEPQY